MINLERKGDVFILTLDSGENRWHCSTASIMCVLSTAGRQSGGCSVSVVVIIHTATAALQHCMQTADSGLASLHGIFAFVSVVLLLDKTSSQPRWSQIQSNFHHCGFITGYISTIVMSVEFNFDISINIHNMYLALHS